MQETLKHLLHCKQFINIEAAALQNASSLLDDCYAIGEANGQSRASIRGQTKLDSL
jgi:hypothetical protein